MDVAYFLKIRTDFIRFYYSVAAKPFSEIQKSIEDQIPPFDNPPYDESGEPAFLQEWFDADLGKEMVGLHCISLLSESMKVYFETLRDRVLRLEFTENKPFRKGFVKAYKNALGEHLGIDWSQTNVNFELIEQVVLARNSASHAQRLNDMVPDHDEKTVNQYQRPFFATEESVQMYKQTATAGKFAGGAGCFSFGRKTGRSN